MDTSSGSGLGTITYLPWQWLHCNKDVIIKYTRIHIKYIFGYQSASNPLAIFTLSNYEEAEVGIKQ
jgi:hypothetical protein